MSLVSYLKALCSRFYSKNENGAITSLRNINDSESVVANDVTMTGNNIVSYTAPTNGRLVSFVAGETIFNGIEGAGMFFCLTNLGKLGASSNNSVCVDVRKGETVRIHTATVGETNRKCTFIPFLGGGVNRLFRCFKEACYA